MIPVIVNLFRVLVDRQGAGIGKPDILDAITPRWDSEDGFGTQESVGETREQGVLEPCSGFLAPEDEERRLWVPARRRQFACKPGKIGSQCGLEAVAGFGNDDILDATLLVGGIELVDELGGGSFDEQTSLAQENDQGRSLGRNRHPAIAGDERTGLGQINPLAQIRAGGIAFVAVNLPQAGNDRAQPCLRLVARVVAIREDQYLLSAR